MSLPLERRARLRVALHDRDLCGIARADRGRSALEWVPETLAAGDDAGANLAVRQAPFIRGVHFVGKPNLDGLPGFLADSLPDAWGRRLIDRQLRKAGVNPRALTGFDRLAIVGARGPGALTYRPEARLDDAPDADLDLDRLARDAVLVLRGDDPEMLTTLERAGGSAGGSRPKVWIAEDPRGRLRSGADRLEADETGWLVKFRAPNHDPEDVGAVEYAYALMARAAGLDIAEPRLFETVGGRYFGSRRFDRDGIHRVHVLTAAGLLDVAAAEAVAVDYVDLLNLTRHITRSDEQTREAFRHAVFNALAHNRDDHLQQFAFRRLGGRWTRTPAYDLTFSDGPGGEHTLLVAGEGRHPRTEHFAKLATDAGLDKTPAQRAVEEVRAAITRWPEFAEAAGVSGASTVRIAEAIRRLAG